MDARNDNRKEQPLSTFAATYTVDSDDRVGCLYYFALTGRAPGPYRTQRHVEAILDIAADGTLAGVELIDRMPEPPQDALPSPAIPD